MSKNIKFFRFFYHFENIVVQQFLFKNICSHFLKQSSNIFGTVFTIILLSLNSKSFSNFFTADAVQAVGLGTKNKYLQLTKYAFSLM
jgi:hypothetical protein